VEMGISFKLSKVGVRVHPAARTASAAPAAGAEKEGSVSDPRREVRGASVVCSIGFFLSRRGILRAALVEVGI
jgi:hypothetical protein